jgi:hypothetical protein
MQRHTNTRFDTCLPLPFLYTFEAGLSNWWHASWFWAAHESSPQFPEISVSSFPLLTSKIRAANLVATDFSRNAEVY